ncbi:ABC transporter substrate-binding protein [Tardiphaga sp. vice304]|uniref:ABC transporter substrate-binding protein n=1 Tax=Tardiphaga sp. vice304 TaxID=2592817 RepID=UPI001AEE08CA|nr:ABC transporter substrate-binding protein [Tardiphaga sp. vice304]
MQLLLSMVLALLTVASSAMAQSPAADVVRDLAPSGMLRAAINFGNGVLAQKGEGGVPRGVSVDLATELARRLGVPVAFVPYEAAGKVFEGAKSGEWDIGFMAIEPVRAAEIAFTAPYVVIEGTYMVRQDSPFRDVDDVDKPGVKIAVGLGSAYDLYLTRTIQHAKILRVKTGGGTAMIEMFVGDHLDVAAGVRQQLDAYAKDHPEMRVMPGHFQEIAQAMGMPRVEGQKRDAGAKYLAAFVEEMKASGFVADALKRSGQVAQVAPPAAK